MSKCLSVRPPRVVFAFFIALITAGCTYGTASPISPRHKHFVPERDSLFKVEFDYPDTLAVKGDKGDSSGLLFVLDPRLPTSQPGLEPDIEQPLVVLMVEEVNLHCPAYSTACSRSTHRHYTAAVRHRATLPPALEHLI